MTSRSTVCFSADGGLHYLSVGIAYFTEDWAPILRVTLNTQNDEETGEDTREGVDASMAATPTANAIRVYTQISTMRGLLDTRFVNPNTLPPWTAMGNHTDACVLADLGQLTTVMLWTGFVGRQWLHHGRAALPARRIVCRGQSLGPYSRRRVAATPAPLLPGQPSAECFDQYDRDTVVPCSLTCYGDATWPASGSPYLGYTSTSLALFQEAMAPALGVDPSSGCRSVVHVQLCGPAQGSRIAPRCRVRSRGRRAGASPRRRSYFCGLEAAATPMENATGDTQPLLLPTYTPVPSISADAVAHNAKVNTSTLSTSSDLLYRSVQLLRGNRRGPILFSTLARGRDAAAAAAVSLNSLIVNFTLRNGVDLHAANATMSDALPLTPPQEVAWRSLFLSIPHTTLSPGPALANKNITAPRRRSSGGLFCC